ncbi:MAG: FHA domain-containing protein [Acidobacteriota bacterium]
MIIQCPSCDSKYQYNEDRFERKPVKKIKCAKCQTIFEIQNPAFAPKADGKDEASANGHEDTLIGRVKKDPDPPPAAEVAADSHATGPVGSALALPKGKRLSLAIIDGPDAGSVLRIEKPRVTIGRSGSDLTLNDSETSRQHAAFEVRETIYTVLDLGSTNGTFINGEKIVEPTEITDKGEFQLGATTLMLIVTDDV